MSTLELALEPVDNQRLANLCGVLDENLKQIERTLGVAIRRRGEHFSVEGTQDKTALAAEVLQSFYRSARQTLSSEDIHLGLVHALDSAGGQAGSEAESPRLRTRRLDLQGRSARQVQYLHQIRNHVICFGVGPAGTGKTYLAVAAAVDSLERGEVKRIVLVRPAVEAGERLGFLPGDLSQKVDPYLRPLYDALYDLMGYERVGRLFERGVIEVAPLAYMRGRTLNHSFIILDEAQNTTPEQMKMFLTRIGFGTKAVITGDVTQIDLHRTQKSGLIDARNVLQRVEGIAFTIFQAEDVVRHPLVQQVVNAYERHARPHE
ncbi:MAG: PhoH family protein [Betaproteobacteria bacterium]|nr:PhoH family protein [Betaproteobacteria bacterium]MDE2623214.1 PhoH family protein [Betaproteobacteria bacterium]